MPLKLFLAYKFIKGTTKESVSTVMAICFLSIAISTGALALVAAVMGGFEKATQQKLQGIHSDLTISSHGAILNYPAISKVLEQEFSNDILAYSPTNIGQLLIRASNSENNNQDNASPHLVLLKSVDPELEFKVTSLPSTVIEPVNLSKLKDLNKINLSWINLFKKNHNADSVIIGKALADILGVDLNDKVDFLYSQDEVYNNKIVLETKEATVSGIFKTGIHEFDEHIVICSNNLFKKLFDQSSYLTEINLKLKDPLKSEEIKQKLIKRLSLEVKSWKDLYPALVSALILEKYAMIFILILVSLISSMNIIALLFMLMQQKQKQIALLKTLGLKTADIRTIFIFIGLIITGSAALIGLFVAIVIAELLKIYPIIELPDVYYVSSLPIDISPGLIVSIFILVLLISLIAIIIPIRSSLISETTDLLQNS